MSNWSGKTLGKVQIVELIARGGMAEVYLGQHTALNRKVAVKIMREHVDADPDNHVRFEREARVVANLRHPNIIQVFDYELVDGQPCLIMELVSGASLGDYLKALHKRGEKLPYATIARLLSALASAIDYAHSQQIIHRDIKPANVLLRSASGPIDPNKPLPADVEPILSDFGLVRLLDSSIQTSTGTVSGTPAYMSPEQARGDKVDSKTDIYSLGVMLYEMLAGTVPFEAESTFGILMKHINETPPPIIGISADLQAIINRTLSKDSGLRYTTAKELADEFTAVFNGQAISANTMNLAKISQKAPSKTKQSRPFAWIWAGLSALLVIGLVSGAYYFSQAPNKVIGLAAYTDQNAPLDKATISFTDLPKLKPGTHYDIWFLAQGGEQRFKAGSLDSGKKTQTQLFYVDKDQQNILSLFDQLEITLEVDNDPNPNEASDAIIASSVFPPLALIHLRHILVSFPTAPNEIALIQGLWGSVDDSLSNSVLELQKAFKNGNEVLIRKKTEEIINQLVGNANKSQYLDWDGDGEIKNPNDDGFGLLQNGDPGYADQGYIHQTIAHANFAAQSADATENIKIQSANVISCLNNMNGWSNELLKKALQIQKINVDPAMGSLIEEMAILTHQIVLGTDSNKNNRIEPIDGECGATTAYEYAYYMADMPLLLGAHRIPPPAPIKNK